MGRRCAVAALGALGTFLAAGCASSATSHNSARGNLAGVLELSSAVPEGSPRPVPGTITMTAADGTTLTTAAGSDGRFLARIAAGAYSVTAHSPMFIINGADGICSAESDTGPTPVTVTAGRTVSVTVVCPTK
ncbi:MAG TPA: hypothetical protein VFZ97_09840 [Acidimicrobiales bacterium]